MSNFISIHIGSYEVPTEREANQKVRRRVLSELPPPDSGVDFSFILTAATFNMIALTRHIVVVGQGVVPSNLVNMKIKQRIRKCNNSFKINI